MPHSLEGVTLTSHNSKLLGTFWRADTQGRQPTVLLLHGIPGVEKQTDLAYALREAGWNCLQIHYRGCWGSQGNYSLPGIVDDIQVAIDYLSHDPHVDQDRLVGVGLSLGGWGVVMAAAQDQRLKAVVTMNPLVDPNARPLTNEEAAEFASMLHGITAVEVQSQWLTLTPLQQVAAKLEGRPTMFLTGDGDTLFTPSHAQMLADAMPFAEWVRLPEASHTFNDHRPIAVKTVLDWLALTFSHPHSLDSTFTLRHPVETDHARVLAVLSDWWGGRDLSHLLPRLYFQHFNDTSFIVEEDGKLVAFLIGFLSQSQSHTAYIHFVGVNPDYRKHHIGQALYDRFFALARVRGAHEVHAITGTVNTGSQAFHARMGFKVSEPIPDYDGPGDDRVTMKRKL
jgi:pimeloyl-ACP methyl ester carboxylesterase/GNAT superfamily N-acetyltransferase